jgi:membrane associated rhomboid family serine protease
MSIGYENAPITQILSATILIFGWLFGSSKFITLELFRLGDGQLWRIITSQLIFENLAQTAVGLMLLYSFRQFERQMGSKKFAFFAFISYIVTLFNLISVEIFALGMDFDFVPASGPYFLVFSLLAIFYCKCSYC